jgi:thiosulfate dehydrogenase [quinone] large subunit
MSIKDHPQQNKNIPVRRATTPANASEAVATKPVAAAPFVAVVRIATGLVFLWAFLDKTFGLGYATAAERAWVDGGSPTKGFLGNLDHGPFADMFRGWGGAVWADWLFMLGLAGIGIAVVFGVGLRIAAVSGTLMMLLMWAAEWPLDRFTDAGEPTMSTNPILDYHILYALVLTWLAIVAAGNTWGFGKVWGNLGFVKKNPWLR